MKGSIILSLVLLMSINVFSQEAGKVGRLLSNEVQGKVNSVKIELNGKDAQKNIFGKKSSELSQYRWNYNYGNSEVFLRIPEEGRFVVEIDDQMIGNVVGKFRFFDLRAGRLPISIYQDDFLIYRTTLDLSPNTRVVLDFFSDYGLYLLDVYPQERARYGVNEWDDVWNDPYHRGDTYRRDVYYGDVMGQAEFANFLRIIKKESFDDSKKDLILSTAYDAKFTSAQIKEMIELLSFDDNKLDVAKKLYSRCVDRRNYYIINEAFNFRSTGDSLKDFILESRGRR